MTTYAPNFTPRCRLKYHAAGIDHTIQARAARGSSAAITSGLATHIYNCFQAMTLRLAADFAWISAEYALTDSDVFIPQSPPATPVGTQAVATLSLRQRAASTGIVGTTFGSRASLFFYGIFWGEGLGLQADNGRVTVAESAPLATILSEANANFRAGNGGNAIFHEYANIKINDHILALMRRGAIS